MGLPIIEAINIIECTRENEKRNVLCLGKQLLGYSVGELLDSKKKYNHNVNLDFFTNFDRKQKLDQEIFFKSIGYENIDTLDFDDYEGANIIFDLNDEKTPSSLLDKYDLIYDGGTLEHVFNISNALKHLTRMTKVNGLIFHSNPCNGYIDHGFFQISPTLYFDYYLANEYNVLYASIIEKTIGAKILSVKQDLYRTLDMNYGPKFSPKGVLNFCVQKSKKNNPIIIPQQGYYISVWKKGKQNFYDVEKRFEFSNFNFIRRLFKFWISLPYYLIEKIKSIK